MIYIYYYLAGLMAFLTPCIVPILPFFISSLLGFNKNLVARKNIIYRTIFFCFGFIIILSLLAAGISAISGTLNIYKNFIEILAGIIMLLFSLYYLELIEIPFFNITRNLEIKKTFKSEYLNSFWLGIIFSITWSPCLSPVMATVLSYITVNNTGPVHSVFKMFFFSLGLASPLLLASFFWNYISSFIKNNPTFPLIIKKALGAFILLFAINIIFSSSIKNQTQSHDFNLAYNKNTLLVVLSIDCTHCEESIETLKKINQNCKDIDLDYLDINSHDAYKIISKYGILGAPSYLFFNSNSELLDLVAGHIDDDILLNTINTLYNINCTID